MLTVKVILEVERRGSGTDPYVAFFAYLLGGEERRLRLCSAHAARIRCDYSRDILLVATVKGV